MMEPWAIDLILLGEFLLIVLLGMCLMTLVRWETNLRDNKADWLSGLQRNNRQLRDARRRLLAIDASAIPDIGSMLTPAGILGMFLKRKRSPRA